MMTIRRSMLVSMLGLACLGACASTGTNDRARTGLCRPDAAAALVGQTAPSDTDILRRTGSAVVRRLAPGDPMTRDYRQERVTVIVADGRVVSASCG